MSPHSRSGAVLEVMLVEWAPLPGGQRLQNLLEDSFPIIPGLSFLIVTVEAEAAPSYIGVDGHEFLEYSAKNVGVRRASGRWVLTTNPDSLLSPELWRSLVSSLLPQDGIDKENLCLQSILSLTRSTYV